MSLEPSRPSPATETSSSSPTARSSSPAADRSSPQAAAASPAAPLYSRVVPTPAREFLARLGRALRARPGLAAALLVALMSVALWNRGATYIEEVSSTLVGIRQLLADDSQHYLDIADDFRSGDFSMSFVAPGGGEAADRAHRQPAYPAVLAVAEACGLSGAPALARVNLMLVVATLWVAFAVGTWVCGNALAGALAAGLVYQAEFLFDIATAHLLTEPLYVLISTATVGAALSYLKKKRLRALLAFAALAALAYLTRVNGLFLTAGLAVAMVASDVRALRGAARTGVDDAQQPQTSDEADEADAVDPQEEEEEEEEEEDRPLLPLLRYGAAVALFLVVASPSWVPRLLYAGNPVYHGYLSNYVWVDGYETAHLPGPPRYSWSTYWSDHSVVDAARRLGHGIAHVYWDTPRTKIGEGGSLVAAIAILALLVARDEAALWLLMAAFLQALPLAWTAMSNDTRRVPAAALMPFLTVLTAAAAARWMRTARRRSAPAHLSDSRSEAAPPLDDSPAPTPGTTK